MEKPASGFETEGGCHCGRVRFRIKTVRAPEIHRCNCSICRKTGYLHLIVGHEDFELIGGAEFNSEYRFNTGVARHLFCSHCGVKSFYVPRSHPDGYSVNYNCLDKPDELDAKVVDFDGQNWRKSINDIRT